MSITFGTLTTGTHPHGSITAGPWEGQVVRQRWWGVVGEAHLTGGLTSRTLTTWLTLIGYASHSALQAGIDTLMNYLTENGSVVVVISGNTTTYTNCTFETCTPQDQPFLDGSGVNGWQQTFQLQWRQIKS